MPAALAGIFHLMPERIMLDFVYAPHAITRHGEWVTSVTVLSEDYDTLFCEYCRGKINISLDPLTGVRSFIHTPLSLEHIKRLTACSCTSVSIASAYRAMAGGIQTPQTAHSSVRAIKSRQLSCETTIQDWQCCWCHICWNGEKVCPQCADWMYAITCSDQ